MTAKTGWTERDRIARENRALLEDELLHKRLTFASRPYHAHVQFSNFCNMSCVMCWDGGNPPLKKMTPDVLGKLASQIAPTLSVITPHDGSEPLLVSWDETRRIAEQHGVRLLLTTNAQFLDERIFHEAKDIVETIVLSIDSHVPEIYSKIRVGSDRRRVFENLEATARRCADHGIECIVQAVFMTLNAPMMPETVAYMADRGIQTVNLIQMIDANGRSANLDPTLHFSAEWIEWTKQRCIAVAKDKRIQLGWQLAGAEWFDFRPENGRVDPHPAKRWNRDWEQRMKLFQPGYCKHVAKGLRITAEGDVAPCGMATGGELHLGSLARQEFDEIWNGANARDLRRAHHTSDYPNLCNSCRFTDRIGPQLSLPFEDHFLDTIGWPGAAVERVLGIEDPAHMARFDEPPVIRVSEPGREVAGYFVAFALGGDAGQVEATELQQGEDAHGVTELRIDEDLWNRLDTNLGYWWSVFALPPDGVGPLLRSSEIRCLIRHEEIPRVEESTLRYPDEGRLPETYLGKGRAIGWTERAKLPVRPPVRAKRKHNRRRFADTQRMSKEDYDQMIVCMRDLVERFVPEGSSVLVVSKGDDRLLQLGERDARHFPSGEDGDYAGFHPRDDDWAMRHLEHLQGMGAGFLVLPAPAFWWLDHYAGFTGHLRSAHAVVAEHESCVIFDIRAMSERAGSDVATEELIVEADRMFGDLGQHRRFWERFHPDPDGDDVLPRFAVSADGYELVDSSGRKFVDWVSGGGPVILGYRHPAVEEAIRAQLAAGPTLSLPHPIQLDVARLLIETIPCAEMVAFGKNGSDAVTAAVRIARAVTGRDMILQHGIHGFHDWHTCLRPRVQGIPKMLRALVHPFPYNDLGALEDLFARFEGDVAGIVMEPVTGQLPEPGYLESVRELAHAHGALLVFDEMVTGFRLANGGAQELYGVVPDVACFGKALSNGMPLSVVAGKREYMEWLPRIAFGMTFRGETLSLAAARAVLETIRDEPVTGHVAEIGSQVRAAFDRACAEHGVRGELRGPEARMTFYFDDHGVVASAAIKAVFLRECARNEVFTNGNFMPTYAHDGEAVDRTERAFERAITAVASLVENSQRTVTEAIAAGFSAARPVAEGLPGGFLEVLREGKMGLAVEGWMLLENGGPDAIELVSDTGEVVVAAAVDRPDLANAFPQVEGAQGAGFSATLPASTFAREGNYEFTLRAREGNDVVFSGRVVRNPGRRSPIDGPRFDGQVLYL
jgi:radical SAM protein with 4Fe4S-binding SPASM domain